MISYATVTKELRSPMPRLTPAGIDSGIGRFLDCVRLHPELDSARTPIRCGLVGYHSNQIAPLFEGAPVNVLRPAHFLAAFEELRTTRRGKQEPSCGLDA